MGTRIDISQVRYPGEKAAWGVLLTAAVIALVVLLISIVGAVYVALFVVFQFFASRVAIGQIRANGIKVQTDQYPEIHRMAVDCVESLQLTKAPEVYIVQSSVMNAFAAKVARKRFVVLFSEIVDACLQEGDHTQLGMIIGHEMGHHAANHVRWHEFLILGIWVPFLYQFWSRRAEYTADRIGLLCTDNLGASQRGLVKLMVGKKLAATVNYEALLRQRDEVMQSWWVRFAEVVATHPHLVKRVFELERYTAEARLSITPVGEGFNKAF